MNTIDRYIIGTFVSSYALLLAVGMGLYIFGDVLFNLDEFTENSAMSMRQLVINLVDYYGHNLPLYYQQLGGVVLGIAAAFTFAMMLKNNELVALVAAGVPLQRLAVPVLGASAVLVGLWVANSEILVPAWAHKIARRHDDLSDTRSAQVQCVRDDNNAILSAGELHAQRGELKQVYIIVPDEQRQPVTLVRADAARYDEPSHVWLLDRGARLQMGAAFESGQLGVALLWQPLDSYAFTLAPEQILLRQSAQWADMMSLRQMNALLNGQNLPNSPAIAKARDIRFMQPLLTLILLLLAVPFFLTCEPANVLLAGGKALVLSGACFAFTFFMHGMPVGSSATLLVTALPLLLFGPIAVLHIANVRT